MKKLNRLFDVLFGLFISIILSSCLIVYLTANKPSFFGYNIVDVLSNSMEESDIYINDKVIIKNIDILDLEVGDIICYNISDNINNNYINFNSSNYSTEELELISNINNQYTNSNTSIWLHHITNIYIDENLNIFYETKGSSNHFTDTYLVSSNDIIGTYVYNSEVISTVYNFSQKPVSKYIFIVMPSSIILIYTMFIIVRLLNIIAYEQKVLNREISLDDEFINKEIIYNMKNKDKLKILSHYDNKLYYAKLLWCDDYEKHIND